MQYTRKTITMNNHVRTIESTKPIPFGFEGAKRDFSKASEGEKESYSLRRTQDNLVMTINCNVNHWSKFITLTFKDSVLEREKAMEKFNSFRKYFKRQFGENLQYVAVTERQKERGLKENNQGSWHFHLVVFNNQKLDFYRLKYCWPYGSVDIKKIDSTDNLGRYLGKYLSKGNENGLNKKSVIKSQGLKQPTITYDEPLPSNMVQTYSTEYDFVSEDTGEVTTFKLTEYSITRKDKK